jgi:outer membrane protein assembly factor BamD
VKIFFKPIIILFILITSCGPKKADVPKTDIELFNNGTKLYDSKNYEEAIKIYEELINTYPLSKLAIEAEFNMSNAYFFDEKYEEASLSYENFYKLHPTNPNIELVLYRMGLSKYNSGPKAIDKDQTHLIESLDNFNELLSVYPNTKYLNEVKEKIQNIKLLIAKKILYIGDFYFKRKQYAASLERYKELKQDYGDIGFNEISCFKIGENYYKLGKLDETKEILNNCIKEYPNSKFIKKAKKILAKI